MDVIKLIRGVKSRQPLWDRKHAYYHDRSVTMGLWDDVSNILGADPDSVRLKWKGLRDTFRGELKKLHKGLVNGRIKTSTNWEYFDEMLFVKDQIYSTKHLKDAIKLVTPYANLDDSNSGDVLKQCKVECLERVEDNNEYGDDKVTSRLKSVENEGSERSNHFYPTSMEEDDDYNFLMSVLPQLRCLPTTRNLYIRLKIQELLYNEIIALQAI